MSNNGKATITATQAKVERDGLTAHLKHEPGYVGRDAYWRVEVYPSAGRIVTGTRETFEGAQGLAIQMLDALERYRVAAQAEEDAMDALVAVAKTELEPAITVVGPDEEPPF